MREAAAAGVGGRRQDVLSGRIVQGVVEARDHTHRIAKCRMRGDVFDAFAVDPDFARVAQALEIFLAGQWSGDDGLHGSSEVRFDAPILPCSRPSARVAQPVWPSLLRA